MESPPKMENVAEQRGNKQIEAHAITNVLKWLVCVRKTSYLNA